MSKDRIEQFIQENREGFDTELPGMHLWGEIDRKISPGKPDNGRGTLGRIAAGIALLFVVSIGLFIALGNEGEQYTKLNKSPKYLIEETNPEFAELSDYYQHRINGYKGRLAAMNHHDPDLYRDLRNMEFTYDTLMVEWNINPHKSDEKLIDALVTNIRSRSMLLENVVNRIAAGSDSANITNARPAMFKEW